MTREEAKSCICTIEALGRLCYRVHGLMDVVDAQNCKKLIEMLNGVCDSEKERDSIPLEWIQKYADEWQDIGYAYDNPILGMLEDWRREQDETY